MTCEQCYVCEQTVLQCSRTMLLAMTYDLCHGGHMVAEYPLLHTPGGAVTWPKKHRKYPLPPCRSYALVQATAGVGTVLI